MKMGRQKILMLLLFPFRAQLKIFRYVLMAMCFPVHVKLNREVTIAGQWVLVQL